MQDTAPLDFDAAVLGGGLPPLAEAALAAAGRHRGSDALALLRAIDPDDCVGAALLETVRQRALAAAAGEDLDEQPAPAAAFGAAAWARTAQATPASAAAA